jgi:TrwC relaxase
VWIGSGAHALGLTGEIDEAQFRALLAGRSPDGAAQWMAPVWRVDPRGKLPVQPLLNAAANAAVDSDDPRVSETLERARRLADRALRSTLRTRRSDAGKQRD